MRKSIQILTKEHSPWSEEVFTEPKSEDFSELDFDEDNDACLSSESEYDDISEDDSD